MKKQKVRWVKRACSVVLAAFLVLTNMPLFSTAEKVQAASAEVMEDTENLSADHVPDSEVRKFYTILANAQKDLEQAEKQEDAAAISAAEKVLEQFDTMTAGEIVEEYGNLEAYTKQVYAIYLTNYSKKINFDGLTVSNVEGIGWARAASEFDLSSLTSITEVPESEFAHCKMKTVKLPSGVTRISDNAFNACVNLSTLGIGSVTDQVVDLTKVTEVGASAFSGCESIEEVRFAAYDASKTELKLGSSAFASCKKLREIKIPIKTAANLGANAFEQCARLTKVGLHNDLAYLSNGLFQGAGAAEYTIMLYVLEDGEPEDSVSRLPAKLTYIGNGCFQSAYVGKMDLSGCTILKKLNQNCFAGADIEELTLPQSLNTIENRAFQKAAVSELDIPDLCSEIGEMAFMGSSLNQVTLPTELTEIKESTFEDCQRLEGKKIKLPSDAKLETIGKSAFAGCVSLETTAFLMNQRNLTTIGESAFAGCCYYVANPLNGSVQKDAYNDNRILCGLETVVLPNCVETLGQSVFADNSNLRTVNLGTGVKELPKQAFANQYTGGKLEKVILSDQLEQIGESAFENQSRLYTIGYTDGQDTTLTEGTVRFGEKLRSIGKRTFAGCGIKSKTVVTALKAYVRKQDVYDRAADGRSEFLIYDYENEACSADNYYCRTVYVDESSLCANLPQDISEEEKDDYIQLYIAAKKVYVDIDKLQDEAISGGKRLDIYGLYTTEVSDYKGRFYSKASSLGDAVYCEAEDVETLVSLSSVSGTLGIYIKPVLTSDIPNVKIAAGTECRLNMSYIFGIQNVELPQSLIEDNLGESAFENCINLKKVTLPDGLTEIKTGTFYGAGTEVDNAVDTNKKYYDYHGLRTINIPDGVKKIGENAFRNCSHLFFRQTSTSALGVSLESIGKYAFSGCYSLESMKFPTSLKEIGDNAFAECAVVDTSDNSKTVITENTGTSNAVSYTYYWNYKKYGTKTEKTGLCELDFTAAKNLEKMGTGAFRQTNVEAVQFPNSPLTSIPASLFAQCSYLRNVSFNDNVKTVGDNVLKDALSLSTVTVPASATLTKLFVSGAFGAVVQDRETGTRQADPVLTFSYKENEEVVVPVHSEVRLPINVFDASILDGNVKIVIVEGDKETDILGQTAKGLWAELDRSTTPYSFILHGGDYVNEPLKVKVEAGSAFHYAGFDGCWLSNHTFTYQVTVKELPTESVSISAAEDTKVKQNPSMYREDGARKTLCVPVNNTAAETEIRLTADIQPADTTDGVSWTSSDSDVLEVIPDTYTKGSGQATAVIRLKKIGDAFVTVSSGSKTDVIYVTGQVPLVSSNGITCTTDGTILDTTLTPNSAANPYRIMVGDTGKIGVSVKYGTTAYTEDQLNTYGEKPVFTSSDETVLVVDQDGTFRAVGEGEAVLTVAGRASGVKVSFFMQVTSDHTYEPKSVTVSGPTEVNVGETILLQARVVPEKASQKVTWKIQSGDKTVSVDAQGNVTGLAKGTASIIAISAENSAVKSAVYKITVNAPVREMKVLNQDVTLTVGASMSIAATTKPEETKGFYVAPAGTTDKIVWSSSDEAIVQITKGDATIVTFKGKAPGVAVLTATASSGVTTSFAVHVIEKTTALTIDKAVTLNVGDTHTLNPKKVPETSNEELTYTYTSSSPSIASVDGSGVIQAVAPGTVSITVKSNTNVTAVCSVTVRQPVNKITLQMNRPAGKKIYMAKEHTAALNAKVMPENATDLITYSSNKPKIAEVSSSGVITAKKKGTAKITVMAESGKKTTLKVVVSKKAVPAKKVKITLAKSVKKNKTIRVKVALKPKKSTDTISFAVNKPKKASIDSYGNLTALKKGKVKVTVTAASGKKASKKIKIK